MKITDFMKFVVTHQHRLGNPKHRDSKCRCPLGLISHCPRPNPDYVSRTTKLNTDFAAGVAAGWDNDVNVAYPAGRTYARGFAFGRRMRLRKLAA